jgi:IS5 family transposase
VALALQAGVELRQSYARLAPRLALQVGRYAHAKQFKRMRKALKKLKGDTGRVMRDLRRHLLDTPEGSLRHRIIAKLALVSHLLHQAPRGANKIYALHEPEEDCISKGKARVRYEFGCKVSIATTLDEGFVVGMRSFPGNPRDGHTLQASPGTGGNPDRPAPRSGRRRPRLSRPCRDQDPRSDQRHKARPDTEADRRPPPPKRH